MLRRKKCRKCGEIDLDKFYESTRSRCKQCMKSNDVRQNGGIQEQFTISQATLDKYSGTNLSRVKELREKYI